MVGMVGISPVWQAMYQQAFDAAVQTVRRQMPGRYVAPSMN